MAHEARRGRKCIFSHKYVQLVQNTGNMVLALLKLKSQVNKSDNGWFGKQHIIELSVFL